MADETKGIGEFNVERGVYVLHNGVEFKTLDEVKAFAKGLEYAKGNANVGMDTVIENTLNGIKDMEI